MRIVLPYTVLPVYFRVKYRFDILSKTQLHLTLSSYLWEKNTATFAD